MIFIANCNLHGTGNHPVVRFRHAINLTNETIEFYDTAGNVAKSKPNIHTELLENLTPDIMVIVTDDAIAKALGIPEENTVAVLSSGIGRDNKLVSRLFRLCDNAHAELIAPSDSIAETYCI